MNPEALFLVKRRGGVAQMVERTLSMREAQGSIPCSSTFCERSYGVVVSISGCDPLDPGSTPGTAIIFVELQQTFPRSLVG